VAKIPCQKFRKEEDNVYVTWIGFAAIFTPYVMPMLAIEKDLDFNKNKLVKFPWIWPNSYLLYGF